MPLAGPVPVTVGKLVPVGKLEAESVRVLGGRSRSEALTGKVSGTPSLTVWTPGTVRTGALLTSLTVMVFDFESDPGGGALSVTVNVMVYVPGP